MKTNVSKHQEWYKKSHIIGHWIRALTLTVGAVFVVATVVPKRPVATIENVQTTEHSLSYEIFVTDEERAIVSGGLSVVLSNQFERKERSLNPGYSSGRFEDLEPGVLYTVEVIANRGFGDERLASKKMETAPAREDMIWVRTDLREKTDDYYLYYADVVLKQSIDRYDEVYLEFGYVFPDGHFSPHETFSIVDAFTQVSFEVYDYNYQVVLRLMEQGGEESRVLHEKRFYPPFRLTSSIYVEMVSEDAVQLVLYPDYVRGVDTIFDIVLYRGQIEIERHRLTDDMIGDPYMPFEITYANLEHPSEYHVDLYVTYTNPDTGVFEHMHFKRIDIESSTSER
jgi:hypothetical protein